MMVAPTWLRPPPIADGCPLVEMHEGHAGGTGFHVFGVMNEADSWTRKGAGVTIGLYSRDQFVPVTGSRYSRSSRLGFIRQHFVPAHPADTAGSSAR